MLIISSKSIKTAYVDILGRLISDAQKYDDPELSREDFAIVQIQDHQEWKPLITYELGILNEPFPYTEYFPFITQERIDQEIHYWNQQFFVANKLPELVQYLHDFPLSKRAIILFWEDKYRDLSKGAVCEIAAFFRIKNKQLEMHTHMRANNAVFLLFMDMRILMGVQRLIAKELNVKLGDYIHVIDSLHIYEAEADSARTQLEFMSTSSLWKQLL